MGKEAKFLKTICLGFRSDSGGDVFTGNGDWIGRVMDKEGSDGIIRGSVMGA